jgi:putative radical SAM enzyme (TIGR03279 family)
VVRVEGGGLAERSGLQPGDRLVSINGHVLHDIIDYQFYAAEEKLELEIERGEKRLRYRVQRGYGEEFGLQFIDDVFDGLRRCHNRCAFCFVDQMPAGMRSSLYIKDDDYRYSFLHGNFITLSNWTERDWERVAEQHLSPLYISVHATDLDLRRRVFNNPHLPDIRAQLRRLVELGIKMHTQIVVLPGIDDGQCLERTVQDLAELYPGVQSIGVVPIGLTRYHAAGLRLLSAEEERAIVEQMMRWQAGYRARVGIGLVYPSDELFLRAAFPIPSAEEYDGFPQLENGIGLARQFLDEAKESRGRDGEVARRRGTVVCGMLIAPLLRDIVQKLNDALGLDITVMPVENRFFGSTVTVSGLLTGRDVLGALEGRSLGDVVFLPRTMFDASGKVTLDGLSSAELESSLGVPLNAAGSLGQMLEYLGIRQAGCRRIAAVV